MLLHVASPDEPYGLNFLPHAIFKDFDFPGLQVLHRLPALVTDDDIEKHLSRGATNR